MKIVIIGNGIAGNQVAFTLKSKREPYEICIISAENVPAYDPCSLPYFLGGDIDRQAVFRKNVADYPARNIDVLFGDKAVSIDPVLKKIITESGTKIDYDKLVLAHGGDLFIPPIKGIRDLGIKSLGRRDGGIQNRIRDKSRNHPLKPGVFSCRQLRETERLYSRNGRCAVIIGSGAIGIEVAEALKKKGYAVHIVELLEWILPALFDKPAAERLEAALKTYGIHIYTGEKILEIQGDKKVAGVVTDKREIACDTVVVATGVIPGKNLAKTAGIDTGQGIRVNDKMQTSVPDIYACGDCVETVDACTGDTAMFQLKHNAVSQANIVARNIAGENAVYPGAHAFARTHFFNTHAAAFGKTLRGTECLLGNVEVMEKEDAFNYLRVILLDGKIIGGQAIGEYADAAGLLMGAMWRKDDVYQLKKKWGKLSSSGIVYSWHLLMLYRLLGEACET